jgi:hypothetical protein
MLVPRYGSRMAGIIATKFPGAPGTVNSKGAFPQEPVMGGQVARAMPAKSPHKEVAMTQLTRSDVVAALGQIDDVTVADIIATGATRPELAEALAWIANDEPLVNAGRPLAGGRTARLMEILASRQEEEESLLESGTP